MDARYRLAYNAAYSDERYLRYKRTLEEMAGTPVPFRLAETPVFLDPEYARAAVRAAHEILEQLCDDTRLAQMRRAVPERYHVPGCTEPSTFAILDFAVAEEDGRLVPRLIELQGFPSLLAFQVLQCAAWSDAMRDVPELRGPWSSRFGLDEDAMLELGRRTIVGDADPQTVAVVDLNPPAQKTYPDFLATQRLFGVEPVDVRALRKRGRKLYRAGAATGERPVERIYYRLVVDELERANAALPFDLHEELDVTWSPHPNWFFVWSKISLPYLDHPAVPATRLLSAFDTLPRDLDEYVLKPLFSFAGAGVTIAPTVRELDAIPASAHDAWCLQERVTYGGVLRAVDGERVKVELRLIFVRPHGDARYALVQNLCRLSRGQMIGVDFNRDLSWVGSSIGLLDADESLRCQAAPHSAGES